MAVSEDQTFVKLLSVAEVNTQNDLLGQLRNKGLKLIGEWDDLEDDEVEDSTKDVFEAKETVDETFDTN